MCHLAKVRVSYLFLCFRLALFGSKLFQISSWGACDPKNQAETIWNQKNILKPKSNLKPNPVQNRPPVKPTYAVPPVCTLETAGSVGGEGGRAAGRRTAGRAAGWSAGDRPCRWDTCVEHGITPTWYQYNHEKLSSGTQKSSVLWVWTAPGGPRNHAKRTSAFLLFGLRG